MDYTKLPYNEVRRKDRAISDDIWIKEFLYNSHTGTLATIFNAQPFINANIFVYDESRHVIYMHTAQVGRTRANVELNNRVCFNVSEMGRLLPANVALEFSVEFSGVTVFGSVHIIDDENEAKYALQLLLDKYFPHLKAGEQYRPTTAEELKRTSVYRIDIEQWSGKRKVVAEDFPGAFRFGEQPA